MIQLSFIRRSTVVFESWAGDRIRIVIGGVLNVVSTVKHIVNYVCQIMYVSFILLLCFWSEEYLNKCESWQSRL